MTAIAGRLDLLRLGPAARDHLGVGRAVAAAALRHRADGARARWCCSPLDLAVMARAAPTHKTVLVVGDRRRRRLPRRQQHRDHRGRDGRRSGRAPGRVRGVLLRALLRRRHRARTSPASSARTSACTRRSGWAPQPCSCRSAILAVRRRYVAGAATPEQPTAAEAELVAVGDARTEPTLGSGDDPGTTPPMALAGCHARRPRARPARGTASTSRQGPQLSELSLTESSIHARIGVTGDRAAEGDPHAAGTAQRADRWSGYLR